MRREEPAEIGIEAIITLFIALIVSFSLISAVADQTKDTTTDYSTTITNESINCGVLNIATSLDYGSLVADTINTGEVVSNMSINPLSASGNYSIDRDLGTITCISTGRMIANSQWNVTYTYTHSHGYSATTKLLLSLITVMILVGVITMVFGTTQGG